MINEKRKTKRIEYCSDILCSKMIFEGEVNIFDPPIEMNIKNIAPEGLCISSLESFAEGAVLTFDIILEDILYQGIKAAIIWRTNTNGTYCYGLHVQNITGRFGIHILEIGRKVFKRI